MSRWRTRAAIDVLGYQILAAFILAGIVNGHDVGVIRYESDRNGAGKPNATRFMGGAGVQSDHKRWSIARSKWFRIGVLFVALLLAACGLLAARWPFTRSAVVKALEDAADAKVDISSLQLTFLPFPGCIAKGVVIHRGNNPGTPPLITIGTLTIEGEYYRIFSFSKHLRSIRTEGMRIRILTDGAKMPSNRRDDDQLGADVVMDELIANRTSLEFISAKGHGPPFALTIHRAKLAPVSGHQALYFETDLHVPEPPGEVHANGHFGPWNKGDAFGTPVSGIYSFKGADLGFAQSIGGILDSQGHYAGTIRRIQVQGTTAVPEFVVRSADHPAKLETSFDAVVDGQTGDVSLRSIDAHFRRSAVMGNGAIRTQSPQDAKRVSLALAVPKGRIEDFLYLFTEDSPPGLLGDMTLECNVVLPPGSDAFWRKLQMDGRFGIAKARFSQSTTQAGLNRISRRAQGEKDDVAEEQNVLSNLQGRLSVSEGTARLSNVTFDMPGVSARLSGTYDLLKKVVNLHGTAHLDVSLSKTTKGIKSFLLKLIEPIVQKRRQKGADVPIKITGSWGHTSLGLDLKKDVSKF